MITLKGGPGTKVTGGGTTVAKPNTVTVPFYGVEDTNWPYLLYSDQSIKSFTANLSASDYLCANLVYVPSVSVAGISNFSDLATWMLANYPGIKYGCGGSGSELIRSSVLNAGAVQSTFITNYQPSYQRIYPVRVTDLLPAAGADGQDSLGTLLDADGSHNGYDIVLANTFRPLPRQLLQEGILNAKSAGTNSNFIFVDDFPYGFLNVAQQLITTAGWTALPGWLTAVRDALHMHGWKFIPNCFRANYVSDAVSTALGKSTDAVMMEFTLSGSDSVIMTEMNLGTSLSVHINHMQRIAAGGALVVYLGTYSGSRDYTNCMNFFTALSMMIGKAVVYRPLSVAIPASASWPVTLGRRTAAPVVVSDIATCTFERGTLMINATNFTGAIV